MTNTDKQEEEWRVGKVFIKEGEGFIGEWVEVKPCSDEIPTFTIPKTSKGREFLKNTTNKYILSIDKEVAYKLGECEFTSETTEEGTTITIKGKNEWDKVTTKKNSNGQP